MLYRVDEKRPDEIGVVFADQPLRQSRDDDFAFVHGLGQPARAAIVCARVISPTITFDDFLRVDIRVGRILEVRPFPGARKPAYQLELDFGPEIGRRRSSAQLTQRYSAEELVGRQILAVINFPPRQVANFFSEVLVLGVPDADGNVVLVEPQANVPLGGRLY